MTVDHHRGVEQCAVEVVVNGVPHTRVVETRTSLVELLRQDLELTGTHVGCEHGVCGACTVVMDGAPVRSCLVLAVQAQGAHVTTVEGLTEPDGSLGPLQRAFQAEHSFQCGYCTPGFVMSAHALLQRDPRASDDDICDAMASNLCRCTGYRSILAGVRRARDEAQPAPTTDQEDQDRD